VIAGIDKRVGTETEDLLGFARQRSQGATLREAVMTRSTEWLLTTGTGNTFVHQDLAAFQKLAQCG
jgi:hypothetical protein